MIQTKLIIMNSDNSSLNTIEEIVTDKPIEVLRKKRAMKKKIYHEYLEIKIGQGTPNTAFMNMEVTNIDVLNEDQLNKIINSCKKMNEQIGEIFK